MLISFLTSILTNGLCVPVGHYTTSKVQGQTYCHPHFLVHINLHITFAFYHNCQNESNMIYDTKRKVE